MKLELNDLDNGIKQVKLCGRLDFKGTNEIEEPFKTQVESSKSPVLVDISEVNFLASIGIRFLLSNAKKLVKIGGKMVILNPQPMVEEVLKTSGIDQLIEIYNDYETACIALKTAISD
ncbi:STAS domain-containing protein [Aphanothece sacrum]|uniref:Anti-sigma factor antagonist n=1 Tax=Aphanothece sacrum FPU1 TaxID=1920663 RepID=A0A401IM65_APHSA|nr:STAS domain-containing protein [Aphanothece sacrum]GBF82318.1 anti-sigma factor antagonist [Aphanothece sacrum FPU1]GBF84218.1 anti-sigma factor antagonist [Aphanothece sacrum FPU3]